MNIKEWLSQHPGYLLMFFGGVLLLVLSRVSKGRMTKRKPKPHKERDWL